MKLFSFRISPILIFIMIGTFWAAPVWGDKPPWAGKPSGTHENIQTSQSRDSQGMADAHFSYRNADYIVEAHAFFNDHHYELVQDYIEKNYRKGKCPPGLAKKGNGCSPPGQAKKWEVGRQLPRDVVFHNLPPQLREKLGPPPPQHRYVRIAEDILLITKGAGMVVDAVEDLNWQLNY